ncbi:MAG: MBL fold metallo-hydrolase [Chloroflexi bacterium]|nr:MBL fold metallo-hydrolase [Chloroflexota bacterium]
MYLEPFFVEGLGHQSYLVGSDQTHEGFVVDPRRDTGAYLAAAGTAGLRLRFVLETHVHNDFLSGARGLAELSGAEHVASAEAGLQFPFRGVRDADTLRLGELLVRVLRTPGHTPEHLSFAVYDTIRSTEVPLLVFTGGDLLVGSVGRPDLLGRELGEQLAPQLFESLHQKLLPLGDGTIVLPAHGGGSLCGRGIAQTRQSTIGYEKLTNPFLRHADRDTFVRAVLQGDPSIPAYYARMRPANQQGPAAARTAGPRPLPAEEVQHLAGHGAVVLDTRQNLAFGGGHVPGAYNVPLGPMLATWTGWLVPHDVPLLLVLERADDWATVTTALQRIGYDSIAGYLEGGMAAWTERGLPVERIAELSVHDLEHRRATDSILQVLDVRTDDEWASGHIPGARHLPLGSELPAQLAVVGLDPRQPVAVVCGSGYRSSIATSLLQQRGFQSVLNTLGGMAAWRLAGLPMEQPVARESGRAEASGAAPAGLRTAA